MSSKSKKTVKPKQSLKIKATQADALLGQALSLHKNGQLDQAATLYKRMLELNPRHVDALHLSGLLASQSGHPQRAVELITQAIELFPSHPAFYLNRGNAFQVLHQLDAALSDYDEAIRLQPNYAEAYSNRGYTLRLLNQVDAAIASCDKAIELNPQYPEAHWNRALALLVRGDFLSAWPSFEWRWQMNTFAFLHRGFSQPVWNGEADLAGKVILLYSEQGLGDTIQFCRYARLLQHIGAKVILEVPQTLVSLLATLDAHIQVVAKGDALPPFDCCCPLMSLPAIFGTTLDSIPLPHAYLLAESAKRDYWARKLGPRTSLRVGLVWSGGTNNSHADYKSWSERRNLQLADFVNFKHDRITFYSLQKGRAAESELAGLLAANWAGPMIVDYTDELADFSDTAALIENLDLVVSVDTSVAHLAGALGKPVWLLNRSDTCWRWMLGRNDSPWYESVTLYRQETPGDWTAVLDRVRGDLSLVVA